MAWRDACLSADAEDTNDNIAFGAIATASDSYGASHH